MPEYKHIIDFHVHPKVPVPDMLQDFDEAGVTHGVILATETDPGDVDRPEIADWLKECYMKSSLRFQTSAEEVIEAVRKSLRSDSHVDNRKAYEIAQSAPDRLIPFGSVNLSKSPEEVQRVLGECESYGFRGIKLLPYAQFTNPEENVNMDILMEYCQRTGSIILSHSGCAAGVFEDVTFSTYSRPMLWDKLLDRYPDVPLVLAHFGAYSAYHPGIWFDDALELMKRHDRVYADLAAVTGLLGYDVFVERVREAVGFEKVLFGTDYPMPRHVPGGSLKDVVELIMEQGNMTDVEKENLLGKNAAKLLNL